MLYGSSSVGSSDRKKYAADAMALNNATHATADGIRVGSRFLCSLITTGTAAKTNSGPQAATTNRNTTPSSSKLLNELVAATVAFAALDKNQRAIVEIEFGKQRHKTRPARDLSEAIQLPPTNTCSTVLLASR